MDFGIYWIYVTQDVTLRLKGSPSSVSNDLMNNAQFPPTIYYGDVQTSDASINMSVKAWINENLCGQSKTMEVGNRIVYTIDVLAEDFLTLSGCGTYGKEITIQVDDRFMDTTVIWDNTQFWNIDLISQDHKLHLPIVIR
jgi:hypothetical protein